MHILCLWLLFHERPYILLFIIMLGERKHNAYVPEQFCGGLPLAGQSNKTKR